MLPAQPRADSDVTCATAQANAPGKSPRVGSGSSGWLVSAKATALARIFGASIDDLVGQPSEFDLHDAVDLLVSAAGKARDQIQRVSASLAEAFDGLHLSVEEIAAMTGKEHLATVSPSQTICSRPTALLKIISPKLAGLWRR